MNPWARFAELPLPCHPAVGDHSCALAGVLLDKGELSLNVSTGSQVSMRSETAEPGDYQTTPFFDSQFIHRISNLPAGRALDALLRLLSELAQSQGIELNDPWTYISKAAESKTGSNVRANLAFFPTPFGDSGSLTNLREENLTVGDVFHAAFLNMAENYYASALRLSPGQSWTRLVFSGGLAQKLDLLRRLISEKFQCPLPFGLFRRGHFERSSRSGAIRERQDPHRPASHGNPPSGSSLIGPKIFRAAT